MIWSLGDYRRIAEAIRPEAESLAGGCGISAGTRVLDVAAGNGNFAVAAARMGATVVASDLAPQMVQWGIERSAVEGLEIVWLEADAEALPFEAESFDVVASTFGAMFGPRPAIVAGELFRVARPDGVVAMTNWTADSFSGRLSTVTAPFTPPFPLELPSPFLWGDPDEVRRRFDGLAASVDSEPRLARFEFESNEAGRQFFEELTPSLVVLKKMLPEERYAELRAASDALFDECARAGTGRVVLENSYLRVIARST